MKGKGSGDLTTLYAYLILCGFIAAALYIAIHELGHGIVAVLRGGRIDAFNLWRGYVSTSGGDYNILTGLLFYAAGVMFSTLCAAVYTLLYRRGKGDVFYRFFSFLYAAVSVSGLGDWILTPLLYRLGRAPRGDDCTVFLRLSEISPWAVSLAAASAAFLLVALILTRGLARDFIGAVRKCLDKS